MKIKKDKMVGMKLRVRVKGKIETEKAIQLSDEGKVEWLYLFNVCMC